MALFNRNREGMITPRQKWEGTYNLSRHNLLLVVLFTLINLGTLTGNLNFYFLFSASIPYALVDLGMFLCGRYPDEYYVGEFDGMEVLPSSFYIATLVIAILILALYFLCWVFSNKNRVGWLIAALVLFSLDTLTMFAYFGISFEIILDVIFHGWVLYYLIMGVVSHFKLKKLPPEEEPPLSEVTLITDESGTVLTTPPLRQADRQVKARILAQGNALGHTIVYRRVKRVNELVIDNAVYDDIELLMEHGHALNALIDGHAIQAGFDGMGTSYIKVDGRIIAKKMRWY